MKVSLRVPFAVMAIVPFVFAVALAQSDAPKSGSKSNAKAADSADAKTDKPRAKPRGRVPAYYNQVIDGQQREKIYSIQQQYEPKISALKAELQALQDKLDAEVEAVLKPDQLAKVKALAEEAKQKRKNSASASASSSSDDGSDSDDAAADAKAGADGAKGAASSKAGK